MTDISKEAVERHIERIGPAPGPREGYHASLNYETITMLRALSARVQELESQTHDQFKASFDRGVLLGLDKAAELAFEYPAEKHGSLDTDPFKAARQATYEVGLAIEALKGDTQ